MTWLGQDILYHNMYTSMRTARGMINLFEHSLSLSLSLLCGLSEESLELVQDEVDDLVLQDECRGEVLCRCFW